MAFTAHVDTFARDHLPPAELQPEYLFELPGLQFAPQLNAATELLDCRVAAGQGGRLCIQGAGQRWTYADLLDRANRVAEVLVHEMGLVPGNRVLLRAPNNPMLAACWFGVIKAGGIAVATMPLLHAKELKAIILKAQVTHALCDLSLLDGLRAAAADAPVLRQRCCFNDAGPQGLEAAMARQTGRFDNVATAADDTCILAFTSGTTGVPKATMHFHRDDTLNASCSDIHCSGSSTAWCSVAPPSTHVRRASLFRASQARPFTARLSASVPPLVKMTSPGRQPRAAATRSRDASTTLRADRPDACSEDALPTRASSSVMAAMAAGCIGVVAAWSR